MQADQSQKEAVATMITGVMPSEARKAREALLALHKAIKNPTKNKVNPFHKNRYADLGVVLEGLKEDILENGFVLSQDGRLNDYTQRTDLCLAITTELLHVDTGVSFYYRCDVPLKEHSPQGGMSALTYGRRYGLLSAFGLVAEDDDGETASGRPPEKTKVARDLQVRSLA